MAEEDSCTFFIIAATAVMVILSILTIYYLGKAAHIKQEAHAQLQKCKSTAAGMTSSGQGNTVQNALMNKCPFDPLAEGKINRGNSLDYGTYLFSGCSNAAVCDEPVDQADDLSKTILNMNAHCGSWNLDDKYHWDYTKKTWKRA